MPAGGVAIAAADSADEPSNTTQFSIRRNNALTRLVAMTCPSGMLSLTLALAQR